MTAAPSCYLQTQTVYFMKLRHIYKDFYIDNFFFAFSDYSKDSRFNDPVNKKVIGKMKDKVRGIIINKSVGLNPKIYSLVMADH